MDWASKITLFLLFFLTMQSVQAQNEAENGRIAIEATVKYGRIADYSFLFEPKVTEMSAIYELHLSQQTNGQQLWHQLYGYPTLGMSLLYNRFGDADIFGQAYALVPTLTFTRKKKKLKLQYRIGVGLGYLNNPYHRLKNPTNRVIGSKLNAAAIGQIALEWKVHPKWEVLPSLSVTHFSNANVQLPNFGINVIALGATVRYYPQQRLKERQSLEIPKDLSKKLRYNLRLGLGITELSEPDGPKYWVYNAAFFVSKRLSVRSKLLFGVEADYYTSIYHFIVNQMAFQEKQAIRGLKCGAFIGHEFLLGQFSLLTQAGIYAYNPFLEKRFVPTKIGFQYYVFPTYERTRKELYLGIYVKGHLSRADHLAIGVGYSF